MFSSAQAKNSKTFTNCQASAVPVDQGVLDHGLNGTGDTQTAVTSAHYRTLILFLSFPELINYLTRQQSQVYEIG